MFRSVNPATGETVAEFRAPSEAERDAKLDRMVLAQRDWHAAGFERRGAVLQVVARALKAEAHDLAALAAVEMGKPVSEGQGEAEKCAWLCEHFADRAEALLAPETLPVDEAEVSVRCDPLGVIFSVTPWNYPFWQIMRAAVPALAAGNAVLNKPASNVIGCARRLAEILHEAGVPEDVFDSHPLDTDDADALVGDGRIAGVCLTGSERAGAAVAAAAGRSVKKSVLELGGSDPFIVLADADIPAAAEAAAVSRFKNAGQVCIASKRMIVERSVHDDFLDAFAEAARAYRPGNPLDDDTKLGPMARPDLRDTLADQVERTLAAGGRCVLDGGVVDGPGTFYAPVIAADIPTDSPLAVEESFGPAAAIFAVGDADEAVALANASSFGLSANLWTSDRARAQQLAPRIEAGGVFINATTASDPRVPFGGIKRSGYGRELGREGIREFVNLKTVWLAGG